MGTILGPGAAGAYFLMRARPDALASTSKALIATGLAGLLLMAVVSTLLSRTSRDTDGGQGGGSDQPREHVPVRTTDDIDAELFRIISGQHLRATRVTPPERPAERLADARARIWRSSTC